MKFKIEFITNNRNVRIVVADNVIEARKQFYKEMEEFELDTSITLIEESKHWE